MGERSGDTILSLDRSPESVPLNNSHPLAVHWAAAGSSHISKYGRRSVTSPAQLQHGIKPTCPYFGSRTAASRVSQPLPI